MIPSHFRLAKSQEETLSLVMNRVKCTAPQTCMTVRWIVGMTHMWQKRDYLLSLRELKKQGERQTKRKQSVIYEVSCKTLLCCHWQLQKPKQGKKMKEIKSISGPFQVYALVLIIQHTTQICGTSRHSGSFAAVFCTSSQPKLCGNLLKHWAWSTSIQDGPGHSFMPGSFLSRP